jgi:hypothetical protein
MKQINRNPVIGGGRRRRVVRDLALRGSRPPWWSGVT